MASREEKIFGNRGRVVSRDTTSSEYDRYYLNNPQPSFESIINYVSEFRVGNPGMTPAQNHFTIVVVGKLGYRGGTVMGVSKEITEQGLLNAWRSSGTYQQRIQGLMGTKETPVHISNIVIK